MRPNTSRRRLIAGHRSNREILRIALSSLLAAAAVFLSTAPIFAADTSTPINVVAASGPADLRLTGPAVGAVGQPVVIVVSGLPAVDLGQTVGEQTRWIDSLRFDVSTPSGPAQLEKELSMSVSPWEWRLRLTLTPASNGCYVVVCDWNEPPYGLALHRVDVGGSPPVVVVPPITPDPTTPALLTGPAYVVVIRRMQSLSADEAQVLIKLRAWADSQPSKTSLLEFSPDEEDSRVQTYVAKVPAGAELPWTFLSRARKDGTGAGVIWSGKLPATEQEIIDRVGALAL